MPYFVKIISRRLASVNKKKIKKKYLILVELSDKTCKVTMFEVARQNGLCKLVGLKSSKLVINSGKKNKGERGKRNFECGKVD